MRNKYILRCVCLIGQSLNWWSFSRPKFISYYVVYKKIYIKLKHRHLLCFFTLGRLAAILFFSWRPSCFFSSAILDLTGGHESLKVSSINHATVNGELCESIIDLGGGELVTEGHEGVSESFSVDLAFHLEGLEGLHDGLVIVGTTGHLGGEEGDHLGEVHGSIGLIKHVLGITGGDRLAVVGESSHEVISGEETIFVTVHDAEGFLELLDGRVGEGVENICFLRHGDVFWLRGGQEINNGVKT